MDSNMVYNVLMSLVSIGILGYFWWTLVSIEPFCYYFTFTQRRFYRVHRNLNTKFDDIIGLDDVKEEIRHTIQNNHVESMKKVVRSKGFYFVGPPGTGKTMMARAIASEINIPFIEVAVNDISSGYVPAVIRTISRKYTRAVVLLDECDTIVHTFNNTLLRQLDGMDSLDNITFILTSNSFPKKNMSRSGRIDRIIKFNLPSYRDRIEFLGKLGSVKLRSIRLNTLNLCAQVQGLYRGIVCDQRFKLYITCC